MKQSRISPERIRKLADISRTDPSSYLIEITPIYSHIDIWTEKRNFRREKSYAAKKKEYSSVTRKEKRSKTNLKGSYIVKSNSLSTHQLDIQQFHCPLCTLLNTTYVLKYFIKVDERGFTHLTNAREEYKTYFE